MHISDAPSGVLLVSPTNFIVKANGGIFLLFAEENDDNPTWSIGDNAGAYPDLKIAQDAGFTRAWAVSSDSEKLKDVEVYGDTTAKSTAKVMVLCTEYGRGEQPSGWNDYATWDEEKRTFFVVETGHDSLPCLVVHEDDPRSVGMRRASGRDRDAVVEAGLDDQTHRVWSVYDANLTEVTGDAETDAILADPGAVAAIAEAEAETVLGDFVVGQNVRCEDVRQIRGVLLTRVHNDGSVWVTHGDGTASQIEGSRTGDTRMGLGVRHDTIVPSNCWVDDGWRYAGFDTTRVPADEGSTNTEGVPADYARDLADAHAVVTAKDEEIVRLNDRIEALQTERDEALVSVNAARAEARLNRQNHEQDIERIGDRLVEECERRDWCEEFDGIVNEINSDLVIPLKNMCRDKEYVVTMNVTVTVQATVNAQDEDAANDMAREMIDESYVRSNIDDISEIEVDTTEEN